MSNTLAAYVYTNYGYILDKMYTKSLEYYYSAHIMPRNSLPKLRNVFKEISSVQRYLLMCDRFLLQKLSRTQPHTVNQRKQKLTWHHRSHLSDQTQFP